MAAGLRGNPGGPRGAGPSLSRPQDAVPQQNQAIQRSLKP